MPRCQGLPEGDCPQQKNDSSVKFGFGELFLCNECEEFRIALERSTLPNQSQTFATTESAPPQPAQAPPLAATPPVSQSASGSEATKGATRSVPVISQLCDITNIPPSDIVESYVCALVDIYRYALQDIKSALNGLEMETLSALHGALFDKLLVSFPQYKDKRPINRQLKHTIVPDIAIMGYCIVNKAPTKDVEKILVTVDRAEPDSTGEGAVMQTELSELIAVVQDLKGKVTHLQNQVKSLNDDNSALRSKVDQVQATSSTRLSELRDEHTALKEAFLSLSDCASNSKPQNQEVPDEHGGMAQAQPNISSDSDTESSGPDVEFLLQPKQLKRIRKQERRKVKKAAKHSNPSTTSDATQSAVGSSQASSSSGVMQKTSCQKSSPGTVNPVMAATTKPIVAAASRQDIYIGGLSPQTTDKDLVHHISALGVQDVDTQHVKVLANKSDWKSVCISVSTSSADVILDRSNWPSGVTVRRFQSQGGPKRNTPPGNSRGGFRSQHGNQNGGRRANDSRQFQGNNTRFSHSSSVRPRANNNRWQPRGYTTSAHSDWSDVQRGYEQQHNRWSGNEYYADSRTY